MSAKELILAARESLDVIAIPNIVNNETRYYQLAERVPSLAKCVLESVREDDDEPITKEWFVEQCKNEEHDFLYVKDNMWLEYRHGTITLEGNADSHNLDQIKTRGQFRRLLEVLGGER